MAAWFPCLPADRVVRQEQRRIGAAPAEPDGAPEDEDAKRRRLPLVVVDVVQNATRLVSLSPAAKRAGLSVGLTLADARARIPDLWVEEADTHADAALLERIGEECDRFSPVVVMDAPDGVMVNIAGCVHLFGGEAELRKAFEGRLRRAGLHVRSVIADAPASARALARYGASGIVASGGEAAAVRRLPVAALELEEADRIALLRAGLKTIADIADRPSLAFAARFGEEMTLRLRRVLGEADPPLSPRRAVPMLWAERRFAEPIGRAEDVEATLQDLAGETGRRLAERREGGRIFEASFFRADGAVRRIAVKTGRPVRDAGRVLRLFREKLDALADPVDPGFGFDLIRLSVPEADAFDAVQASLDGKAIEEDEVADLVDRLSTRFGQDRVLSFLRQDTHNPDRAAKAAPASFNPLTSFVWPAPEEDEPPLRPSQMFDPPQPISATAEVPDGPPLSFRWRKATYAVKRGEGPERIAPEWWREAPGAEARDYYRIEDAEGRRFWIFRVGRYGETPAPRWYLHGLFA